MLLDRLYVFCREVTKTNGRPVIKHDDIQPVSVPYQRYKVIFHVI